jgi:hypothetical protein
MTKPSRNDPCPCGSGKKYKKCCLTADAARVTQLDAAVVDIFQPAAVRTGHYGFVPAIACLKETDTVEDDKFLFTLVRASRPLPRSRAIDEAIGDLDSVPDAADDAVGPGCLRYLDKIGYRRVSEIGLDQLAFPSMENSNDAFDYDDDDDSDDDDIFDGDDFEADSAEMVEFIQRLASIPVAELNTSELGETLSRLCQSGLTREEAIVTVLQALIDEIKTEESDASAPDRARFSSALARLSEIYAE